jgi:phytoene/squalene synthetase
MSDVRSARDRALRLYDATAARTSAGVLAAYSTSFGLGTRLLGRRAQQDIRAVYALVRLADEVVDTYRGDDAGAELDELEEQTVRALRTGYSTNLIVHAFARTARRVGITAAETAPFFASMRADLTVHEHDRASFDAYVYGSAEVVGLMCVRAFLNDDRRPGEPVREPDETQVAGARALGAAFQKINFLRDLGADTEELGRTYFPGTTPGHLDQRQLDAILAEISTDVAVARAAVPTLPTRARYAVGATLGLYQRLLDDIAARPPASLLAARVRLPTPVKLLVVGESVLAEARSGRAVRA